jgi:hypothetical protein
MTSLSGTSLSFKALVVLNQKEEISHAGTRFV